MQMKHADSHFYTKEFKDAVLAKVRENAKYDELSEEFGIPKQTIYTWAYIERKKALKQQKQLGRPPIRFVERMNAARARYTPEFKQSVINRVLAGDRHVDIAMELEMPLQTVYNWAFKNRQAALRRATRRFDPGAIEAAILAKAPKDNSAAAPKPTAQTPAAPATFEPPAAEFNKATAAIARLSAELDRVTKERNTLADALAYFARQPAGAAHD